MRTKEDYMNRDIQKLSEQGVSQRKARLLVEAIYNGPAGGDYPKRRSKEFNKIYKEIQSQNLPREETIRAFEAYIETRDQEEKHTQITTGLGIHPE